MVQAAAAEGAESGAPKSAHQNRILASVKHNEAGCWEWKGARSASYGYLQIGGKRDGAHRVSYEAFVGAIPPGYEVDHLCRNPRCVNPAHLEPVTHRENTLRGVGPTARQAQQAHCLNGHLLAGSNLLTAPSMGRRRQCRQCTYNRQRRYRAERAENRT